MTKEELYLKTIFCCIYMIGKLKKGSSFAGCIRYVTGKDEAKILASDGVLLGTNAEMTQSFELQRQRL